MKSGIEAAKVIASNIEGNTKSLDEEIKSWLYTELYGVKKLQSFLP